MSIVMLVVILVVMSSCRLLFHDVSYDGGGDVGSDVVMSIVMLSFASLTLYLCHNPSDFLAASTLSTSWHRITTAALMPVAIERILYEATQQRCVPFIASCIC